MGYEYLFKNNFRKIIEDKIIKNCRKLNMKISNEVNIDDIYKKIGEIGSYQCLIIILVGLVSFNEIIVGYSYSFYGNVPDYR